MTPIEKIRAEVEADIYLVAENRDDFEYCLAPEVTRWATDALKLAEALESIREARRLNGASYTLGRAIDVAADVLDEVAR